MTTINAASVPQATDTRLSPAPIPGVPTHSRQAPPRLLVSLDDVGRADIPTVGGKGANLGEMRKASLPVPPGFVLTVAAYEHARASAAVGARVDALLRTVNVEDTASLQRLSLQLRQTVASVPFPSDLLDAVSDAYAHLTAHDDGDSATPLVAVRSSATAEDTADYSFAGMFETVLGVRSRAELLEAIRQCWSSTFGARVLYYRLTRKMPAEMPVAVVVQRMIPSERAGVLFTADPATGDTTRVVLEAAWGLGEVVVSGAVTPDHYVVDKRSGEIVERRIARKDFMLVPGGTAGGMRRIALDNDPRAESTVLRDADVATLVRLAAVSEQHYGAPQDMEFAITGDDVFITQTRPITTLARPAAPASSAPAPTTSLHAPLVRGLGASPGLATGRVRVLASPDQAALLQSGEVLVAPMTSPDWVPIMRRACAIVTDAGGMTAHAAIVSRELGIPCVVGTRTGSTVLTDGMLVTVNGRDGTVISGAVTIPEVHAQVTMPKVFAPTAPVTATRIYVNLGDPAHAAEIAGRDVDGVGLLRAEFLMLSALEGMHPRALLASGGEQRFIDRMTEGVRSIAAAFAPRPVIYRAMDFRSNEFRALKGGAEHEPVEANPMIGYRGCFRYVREPDLFALELRVLAQVRREYPNLHLMLPFVRTGWEMQRCRALIDASPLANASGLELWVMAEVPSVVSWMDEYVRFGVTGVSIGSNDLTQLILGVDRDSGLLAGHYDERDRAVMDAIHAIIDRAHSLGITASICGQAPSVYPEVARQLVRWGIDSISVNPDTIEHTRRVVASVELAVLLEAAHRGGPPA